MRHSLHFLICAALLMLGGCSPSTPPPSTPPKPISITLATTTSTQDSGLLDALVPTFEQESGVTVKVVAVGSGQALELGRKGDADVLLTHSPKAEEEFMAAGDGSSRQAVMHNDFVIVGPAADPADIKGATTAVDAFRRLLESKSPFVSRDDESGTHTKELAIWKKAEITPLGDWYLRAGSGMAATLRVAHEKLGYTLSDRATFLAQRKSLELVIVAEGDASLRNPYAVIVVNSDKHPHLNPFAANLFAAYLLSPRTQKVIAAFGVETYGQPLFFPNESASP